MDRTAKTFAVNAWLLGGVLSLALASTSAGASEPCGTGSYPFPYTDVAGVTDPFCPGIMEAYVTGVSKGTTPTTFSPNNTVTRVQMTTFLQRSLDQGLARMSRRAALNNGGPAEPHRDAGDRLRGRSKLLRGGWREHLDRHRSEVVQVQANTGAILGTWTGATCAGRPGRRRQGLCCGQHFARQPLRDRSDAGTGRGHRGCQQPREPSARHRLRRHQHLDCEPGRLGVDHYAAVTPYTVTTVSTGFSSPYGILYDGAHIWVTDSAARTAC